MRLNSFMNEEIEEFPAFTGLLFFAEGALGLNEVSDETIQSLKKLGAKVGVRVKKTDSIFTYLKRAGRGMENLLRYASMFMMTDVTDNKTRKKIMQDIKKETKKVDKKAMMDFFMQIDKGLLHFTSIPRHVLMSLFGIEVTTFHKWMEDREYIEKETRHIRKLLQKMEGADKELALLDRFEKSLLKMVGT